jgi:hypothetical protein
MRMYRLIGAGVALLLALGTSTVAFADFGGGGSDQGGQGDQGWEGWWHHHHGGPPGEVKPPGATGAWGDVVNTTPTGPTGPTGTTGPVGSVRAELGFVNGYFETTSHTQTPPNLSAFTKFPGVETMEGHENIYSYVACTPAGTAASACAGTTPTGTNETAALDECNPCTMFNSAGKVIGTGSIDMPWWQSRGAHAHQHVSLLMHGTGTLANVHGVLIHPSATDPRCAAGVGTPHYVGCYWGTVHQDKCISGNWHGPLFIAPGQSGCVLPGGKVFGPTHIGKDGELFAEGATFYGPIRSEQGEAFSLCSSAVLGPVSVTETTGPVMIGSPETGACGGNFIQGPLSVEHNGCATCDTNGMDTGSVEISGDTVVGPLRSNDNVGAYVVGYFVTNSVSGPITEEGNK